MSNGEVRGRFVWHDVMTTDPEAARAFYRKVVGWKTQPFDLDPSYTMFVAPAGPVGGAMMLPDDAKAMGAPPSWMSFIGTPNVDETCSRAQSMGARVLKAPANIPSVGRFAVLADPQGASFAIFAPGGDGMGGGNGSPGLGEFSWHELATSDPEGAWVFYSTLFGWQKTSAMDMGPQGVYQMFGLGGEPMGGIYRRPETHPMSYWLPYAMVADAKKAESVIKAAGGRILNGPMEVPGGDWIVVGMDPQGASFAVHAKAKAAKAAAPAKKPARKPARKPAKKRAAAKKKPARRKPAARSAKKRAPARRKPARKKKATRGGRTRRVAARRPVRRAKPRRSGARKKR